MSDGRAKRIERTGEGGECGIGATVILVLKPDPLPAPLPAVMPLLEQKLAWQRSQVQPQVEP